MDAATLEALKASIRKWDKNAAAEKFRDYRVGSVECPLCAIFNNTHIPMNDQCLGCVVFEKTNERHCVSTPYIKTAKAWSIWRSDISSNRFKNLARMAARAEAAFLRSLLPEGETVE